MRTLAARLGGILALCLLAVAGCGTPATAGGGPATPTPASVPASVVGSVTSIRMFDAASGWATASGRLLRTADGGLHWRDVTPPTPPGACPRGVTAFSLSASDAWVVRDRVDCGPGPGASQSVVSRTTDGGRTWRTTPVPVFAVGQITFADTLHGWMLADLDTGGGQQAADVFRTADGGQTWAKVASAGDRPGALPLDGEKFGLTFRDATTGWVAQGDALDRSTRLHGLFRTQDGGVTWHPAPAIAWPTGLARDPSLDEFGRLPTFFSAQVGLLPVELVAQATGDVADTLFYVTRDGGATWSPTTPLPAPAAATGFSDATSLLDPTHWWITPAATDTSTLVQTSDGGQHWASWTPGAPFSGVSALDFVSPALGWAIGSAGLLRTSDGGRTWTVLAPAPPAA